MKQHRKYAGLVLTSLLVIGLTACGGREMVVEPEKINSINKVAIISFTVPFSVGEKPEGMLSGVMAGIEVVTDLVTGEEKQGNGEEVANETVVGFVDGMQGFAGWEIIPVEEVQANSAINGMVKTYGEENADLKASMTGTPAIITGPDTDHSEFAAAAARALRVDGVIIVYVSDMAYSLFTGVSGTGEAKGEAKAFVTLYDRQGNYAWESYASIVSDESAAMVAGALNPAAAPRLHRSVGQDIAEEITSNYNKNN